MVRAVKFLTSSAFHTSQVKFPSSDTSKAVIFSANLSPHLNRVRPKLSNVPFEYLKRAFSSSPDLAQMTRDGLVRISQVIDIVSSLHSVKGGANIITLSV